MTDQNDLNGELAAGTDAAQRKEVRRGVLRKLAGRAVPTAIERVRGPSGQPVWLVIERLPRDATISDDQAAAFVRDAKATATLQHPNIVRGRAVSVRQDEIIVANDYVEGERLSELFRTLAAAGSRLPCDLAVRILSDVLSGLTGLHDFADSKGSRLGLIHGELTAANVLVGVDGVSRLLHTARIRRPGTLPPTETGWIAPEILAGASADPRADIFSVGVLLWQALSGVAALTDASDADLVVRIRTGKVERAPVPRDAPWAGALVDVASRAMAVPPENRYPSAAVMNAELRKIAVGRLPGAAQVAQFLKAKAGEKIETRRKNADAALLKTSDAKTTAGFRIAQVEPAKPSAQAKPPTAVPVAPSPPPAVSAPPTVAQPSPAQQVQDDAPKVSPGPVPQPSPNVSAATTAKSASAPGAQAPSPKAPSAVAPAAGNVIGETTQAAPSKQAPIAQAASPKPAPAPSPAQANASKPAAAPIAPAGGSKTAPARPTQATVSKAAPVRPNPPLATKPVAAPSAPVAAPSPTVAAPSPPVAAPSPPVAAPSPPVAAPSPPVAPKPPLAPKAAAAPMALATPQTPNASVSPATVPAIPKSPAVAPKPPLAPKAPAAPKASSPVVSSPSAPKPPLTTKAPIAPVASSAIAPVAPSPAAPIAPVAVAPITPSTAAPIAPSPAAPKPPAAPIARPTFERKVSTLPIETTAKAEAPPDLAPKQGDVSKPFARTQLFGSNVAAPPPVPTTEGKIEPKEILDVDGSEAISVPPSLPPAAEDSYPTFPRIPIAGPSGVTPPVTERPMAMEPKVVISPVRVANEEDIFISDSVPPARPVVPAPPFARAWPAPPPAPVGHPGPRFDTPAAAPVMAPALPDDEPTRVERPMNLPTISDAPRLPNTRRARVIIAAVSTVVVVIGAIALFQLWQKPERGSTATPDSVVPTATARTVAQPRNTVEATSDRPTEPPPTTHAAPETHSPETMPLPTPTPNAPAPPSDPIDDREAPGATDPKSSPSPAAPSFRTPRSPGEPSPGGSPPVLRPKFDPKRI